MKLKHRIIKISSTGDIVFFSEGDLEAMSDVHKRGIEHILGRL